MDVTQKTSDEQVELWNGVAGCAWVEEQELLDRMFKPFEEMLADTVSAGNAINRVLDVGCGTGSTTVAMARRVGSQDSCLGIDISEPMIRLARMRAEREGVPVSFIVANAQTHALEPASFDMIVSRFGVMFFDDSVAAFENLRRAVRQGGGLEFIAWRAPSENPFMTTAERAAATLLPNLPPRRPGAPGQFAFGDSDRVRGILEQSGWAEIEILPIDIRCSLPEKELVRYFTRFGPVGLMFAELDEGTRGRVVETVRAAFDSYVNGAEVSYTAACWMVRARNGAK